MKAKMCSSGCQPEFWYTVIPTVPIQQKAYKNWLPSYSCRIGLLNSEPEKNGNESSYSICSHHCSTIAGLYVCMYVRSQHILWPTHKNSLSFRACADSGNQAIFLLRQVKEPGYEAICYMCCILAGSLIWQVICYMYMYTGSLIRQVICYMCCILSHWYDK